MVIFNSYVKLPEGTYHIYKAYLSGLFFCEYHHNSYGQKYGTFTYLHQLNPGDLSLRVGLISGPFLEQNLDM